MDSRTTEDLLTVLFGADPRDPDMAAPHTAPAPTVTVHVAHLELATLNVAINPPSNALQTPPNALAAIPKPSGQRATNRAAVRFLPISVPRRRRRATP
jgi:hypothetical protein